MGSSQYKYGHEKEKKVAQSLRGSGMSCNLSTGSRGASDIQAEGNGKKWKVQVKATRTNDSPSISSEELRRLKIQASRTNSTPVIAEVNRGQITFRSARNGRKLKP